MTKISLLVQVRKRNNVIIHFMILSLGGVCIDMLSRCDNINDCADKSDEADCSRVRENIESPLTTLGIL